MKRLLPIVLLGCWAVSVMAQTGSQQREPEMVHLKRALHEMDMTMKDLAFDKDHGEPIVVLEQVRNLLNDPIQLYGLAEETLSALVSDDTESAWKWTSEKLEALYTPYVELDKQDPEPLKGLDPALGLALDRFVKRALKATDLVEQSLQPLNRKEQQELLSYYLCQVYNPEDHPDRIGLFPASGVPTSMVLRTMAHQNELDPEPYAHAFIENLQRADRSKLLHAGQVMQEAVRDLSESLGDVRSWPEGSTARIFTDAGVIYIGTKGADRYDQPALLVLDPGGDDTYADAPGAAGMLVKMPVACVLDMGGQDCYTSFQLMGPGTAWFGVSVMLDLAGRDVYRAGYSGQGSAFAGAAWVEDREGDDLYEAHAFSQAAAVAGAGFLKDDHGHDSYRVGFMGQGFSGMLGAGFLLEIEGNDLYFAGGRERDHERNDNRFISMGQGMSIGLRPYAGGGYAALIDLEGNDTYRADIFGQGVGYWYSVGMLIDSEGNDTYTMYQYGQGSGIHLSLGLLVDGAGDDMYTSFILAQGNAHDYAVGFMLELSGNDTYTADHHAQGRALNNGLALLVDSQGNDAYFARQNDQAQGIGNDGGKREYGSLAILLDLQGQDQYSSGAPNGENTLRPDFGIIYDLP